MLFADAQLDAAPASFVKWFVVCLIALVSVAGIIVAIIAAFRKAGKVKLEDEPAISTRVKAPRFNHDLAEARYAEVTRRLAGHDAEIEQLWRTMRGENADIRKEMGAKFDSILLALGEIKGELKHRL